MWSKFVLYGDEANVTVSKKDEERHLRVEIVNSNEEEASVDLNKQEIQQLIFALGIYSEDL